MQNSTYKIIGLMSGTSLDGLDIALCEFTGSGKSWKHSIIKGITLPYPNELKAILSNVQYGSAQDLAQTDAFFGRYCGKAVKLFLEQTNTSADFIASHGHTIFHQPNAGYTYQIGNGAYLSAEAGLPVISDFRTMDVGLGGQGAPLVPIGDALLFHQYRFCLNLGGISNISFDHEGKRIAFDISPVNLVLNFLAGKLGKSYDPEGSIARTGKVNDELLRQLNALNYYQQPAPKSLGKEWLDTNIFPLLESSKLSTEDLLCTFTHHTAFQIARVVRATSNPSGDLLITGGGAYNTYLIESLRAYCPDEVRLVVPDEYTLQFKEALIFAFLGLLRKENMVNALSSVTGASKDSIGGAVYGM
jgi:anhydro-N-acetylmuramic acid kinase